MRAGIGVGDTAVSISGVGARAYSTSGADARSDSQVVPSSVAGACFSSGKGGGAGSSSRDHDRADSGAGFKSGVEVGAGVGFSFRICAEARDRAYYAPASTELMLELWNYWQSWCWSQFSVWSWCWRGC